MPPLTIERPMSLSPPATPQASPLKVFAFAFYVIASAALAMIFPEPFTNWGGFDAKRLIFPMTAMIMFGMGAMLSWRDFARALHAPAPLLAGVVLQFTVMPLVGWGLVTTFGFTGEVAAGVILVGSCSGGVASNVMTFLGRGDVALSVTMTACSTMLAPVMTPLAMKLLAGRFVEVHLLDMMVSILKLVVIPVGLGLVVNAVMKNRRQLIERVLPPFSMFLVCFAMAIMAATVRDRLLQVGMTLALAALCHNAIGLLLGYQGALLMRLPEDSRRTVSFEVGMQNGGMGVALAVTVLNSPDAAIAPGMFAVAMNISGAVLSSWWRSKPIAA